MSDNGEPEEQEQLEEEEYEEEDGGKEDNMNNMNFADKGKPKKINNEHYDMAYEVNDSGNTNYFSIIIFKIYIKNSRKPRRK